MQGSNTRSTYWLNLLKGTDQGLVYTCCVFRHEDRAFEGPDRPARRTPANRGKGLLTRPRGRPTHPLVKEQTSVEAFRRLRRAPRHTFRRAAFPTYLLTTPELAGSPRREVFCRSCRLDICDRVGILTSIPPVSTQVGEEIFRFLTSPESTLGKSADSHVQQC